MRPSLVAFRPLALVLVATVAAATFLATFHHHRSDCDVSPASGSTDRTLVGDCVVCRLAEPKSSLPEIPQAAPGPSAAPDELAPTLAKEICARAIPIRAPRAPPAEASTAV